MLRALAQEIVVLVKNNLPVGCAGQNTLRMLHALTAPGWSTVN